MAYTDEREDKFYNAISRCAEEQRKKVEREIAEFKKRELEQTENEVLAECYRMIQTEVSQMRTRIARDVARQEMDLKRNLLQKRQAITENVFCRASGKLQEYVRSEQYEEFLKKSAKSIGALLGGPGTVVVHRPGDEKYEAAIREAFGSPCSFRADDAIRIGGIRAQNEAKGLLADETLDTLLENQREWFQEQSGMVIT